MRTITSIAAAAALVPVLCLSACEESGSSSGSGADLADHPQSMYGRSAGSARDLADSIRNNDAATTALADRLAGSGTIEVSGLVFDIPQGWESVAPGDRSWAARINAPGVTIAIFDKSGSVDGAIEDWEDSFTDASGSAASASVKDERFGGIEVTLVELGGTWSAAGPAGLPEVHENWALLGAIFPQGRSSLYLRATGPADAIDAAYDDWMSMIESVHRP